MNGLTPPKSGAAEWPPGPTPRASRGAPEPSDAFAGILDTHQARTATAEGPNRSPKKTEGRNRRDDDGPVTNDRSQVRREADNADVDRPVQHHGDDAQAKPADSADVPAAPVAEAQPVVPQAQPVQPAAPVVNAEAVAAPVVAPEAQTQTQPQTQPQAPAAAVATQVAPEQQRVDKAQSEPVKAQSQAAVAEQAVAASDEQAPVVQQPQEQPDAKPASDKPAPQVAVAAPKQDKPQTGQQQQQGNQSQQQQQGSLPQPAGEQARTVAQAYGRSAQHGTSNEVPTTAQSGTPAASPATPVAGGQPAAARGELAPATPVPLSRAAETVEHVMRLASSRGVTHARIALTPESLGSLDVHLRHTAEGVVAKLVAHSPEAVHQLQQAAADLRQQLEGQGVNLLSLDIGQSAADEGFAASAGAGFAEDGRGESRGDAEGGDATGADAEITVNSTLQLPDGVLVDVLA